jgi:hypothetical protein
MIKRVVWHTHKCISRSFPAYSLVYDFLLPFSHIVFSGYHLLLSLLEIAFFLTRFLGFGAYFLRMYSLITSGHWRWGSRHGVGFEQLRDDSHSAGSLSLRISWTCKLIEMWRVCRIAESGKVELSTVGVLLCRTWLCCGCGKKFHVLNECYASLSGWECEQTVQHDWQFIWDNHRSPFYHEFFSLMRFDFSHHFCRLLSWIANDHVADRIEGRIL